MSLLDTSVLVAGLVPDHPRHAWARPHLLAQQVHVGAHSLAETYSVLSGSPQIRLGPDEAAGVVARLAARFEVVPLDAAAYLRATARVAGRRLGGGAVYDALLAEAALAVNAGALVTLNPKHFLRLGADVAQRVVAPVL